MRMESKTRKYGKRPLVLTPGVYEVRYGIQDNDQKVTIKEVKLPLTQRTTISEVPKILLGFETSIPRAIVITSIAEEL